MVVVIKLELQIVNCPVVVIYYLYYQAQISK